MEGRRDFQGVGIKGGNWSTSEGKSERSGWMRRQHENCCFCLYSWLVKRRLTLQPELGLHKSKACKQDYLSVSTSVYTHTHTHTVHSSIHQKILKGKVTQQGNALRMRNGICINVVPEANLLHIGARICNIAAFTRSIFSADSPHLLVHFHPSPFSP